MAYVLAGKLNQGLQSYPVLGLLASCDCISLISIYMLYIQEFELSFVRFARSKSLNKSRGL